MKVYRRILRGYKAQKFKNSRISSVEKELLSQGEGAYGNIVVHWTMGGAHSMFYKVEKGKVEIYDTQANKKRDLNSFPDLGARPYDYARMDNCEPTERVLGALVKR